MHFDFHYTFNLTKLFWPPPLLRKTFWSPPSGNSKLFWPPLHFAQPPHQSIYERSFVRLVHRCLLNLMLLIDRFPANAINIDHGKSRPYLLFPCIDEGQGSTKNSRYVKYRVENISWKTIYELTAQFQITDFPWFGLVWFGLLWFGHGFINNCLASDLLLCLFRNG